MTETEFGASSSDPTCSGQYCARASIGSTGAGESNGSKYTASFGPVTSGEPLLDVIVDQGASDLGELTTERTATKTMTVQIRNYLSEGYVLQIVGDPPKVAGHTLKTPTTPTASQPGQEQFALNAVANTTPQIGADPVQVPSNTIAFGSVLPNYRSPNLFAYSSGDTIAKSISASGQTNYTISMIVNIASSTPAGHYAGDYAAIVTPIY